MQEIESTQTPALRLSGRPIPELFDMYTAIGDELRQRGIMRTSNNLVGDLAEFIFSRAMGWTLERNSKEAVDAVDALGTRYQIKGRRLTPQNSSRQLGALRKLDTDNFDMLAAILFNPDYSVQRAILLPCKQVVAHATYIDEHKLWKFMLTDDKWQLPEAQDVTEQLRAVNWE